MPSTSTSFLIAFRSVTGERTTTMLSFRAQASEDQLSRRADEAPEGQTFPSACATARLALSLTSTFCKSHQPPATRPPPRPPPTHRALLLLRRHLRAHLREAPEERVVRRDLDRGAEVRLHARAEAARVDEDARARGLDERVREEDGVVVDVGAAEVEQPRDLVEHAHDERARVALRELRAHLRELLGVREACGRR